MALWRSKDKMPADKSKQIQITPSDCIGAVRQGAAELHHHMQQPLMDINAKACIAHCEHMIEWLDQILTAQAAVAAAAPADAQEKRAN